VAKTLPSDPLRSCQMARNPSRFFLPSSSGDHSASSLHNWFRQHLLSVVFEDRLHLRTKLVPYGSRSRVFLLRQLGASRASSSPFCFFSPSRSHSAFPDLYLFLFGGLSLIRSCWLPEGDALPFLAFLDFPLQTDQTCC